jgi:hypothetical protein
VKRAEGDRVCIVVPRSRVTKACGLMAINGAEVTLVSRFEHADVLSPCWIVDPPQFTVLRAAAQSDGGEQLHAGDRLQLRAVPEAWMRGAAPAWSAEEVEYLQANFGHVLAEDMAAELGRSVHGVRQKVQDLGLRCVTRWTPELDEFLELLFPDTAATELEQVLGATAAAIRRRAEHLGIRKAEGFTALHSRKTTLARSPFTPEIAEVIELLYPDTLTQVIADFIGMPLERVHAYATHHGWKKTPEFVRETARARTTADHPMRRYQFPKGHVPANKGRKGMPSHPNMIPTQFKKGNRPHTWKPIGAQVVNDDGYLVQKVSETGYPPRDWKPVHRLVWIAAHGEIPPGHIVRFRQGCKTTDPQKITADVLECITLAENARRNVWHHNMPADLRKLVGARIALKRAINSRQKDMKESA